MRFLLLSVFALSACRPDAPVITANLEPELAGTDDTLSVVIDKPEDVEVQVRWFLDGMEQLDLTAWDVPSTETAKGQEWMVIALALQGERECRPAWDATIIANSPPVASVQISPEYPQPGDELLTVTTATDADDDPVTYAYAWAMNGENQVSYTRDQLPDGVTQLGETWTVTVTPKDPDDRGALTSDSVIIGSGDSVPEIYSVHLSPDPAYTNSTLSAEVEASVATTSFTYTWVVNYVAVLSGPDAFLAGDWFVKHDNVSVRVLGTDGFVTTSEMSSETLSIHNSPPGAPGVSISPEAPDQGVDTLICTLDVASTDADGDIPSYRFSWTAGEVGDNADGFATTTHIKNDTIPAESTSKYDVWTCTVTPYDGETWGTPASVVVDFGAG